MKGVELASKASCYDIDDAGEDTSICTVRMHIAVGADASDGSFTSEPFGEPIIPMWKKKFETERNQTKCVNSKSVQIPNELFSYNDDRDLDCEHGHSEDNDATNFDVPSEILFPDKSAAAAVIHVPAHNMKPISPHGHEINEVSNTKKSTYTNANANTICDNLQKSGHAKIRNSERCNESSNTKNLYQQQTSSDRGNVESNYPTTAASSRCTTTTSAIFHQPLRPLHECYSVLDKNARAGSSVQIRRGSEEKQPKQKQQSVTNISTGARSSDPISEGSEEQQHKQPKQNQQPAANSSNPKRKKINPDISCLLSDDSDDDAADPVTHTATPEQTTRTHTLPFKANRTITVGTSVDNTRRDNITSNIINNRKSNSKDHNRPLISDSARRESQSSSIVRPRPRTALNASDVEFVSQSNVNDANTGRSSLSQATSSRRKRKAQRQSINSTPPTNSTEVIDLCATDDEASLPAISRNIMSARRRKRRKRLRQSNQSRQEDNEVIILD